MAIERLNKTFVDGEVWDSTDINPITTKIDECIDQINLNTDEIETARDGETDLNARINRDLETNSTYRDEAYKWANEDEDTQVTDSAGHSGYSAYHYSKKAEVSANAAAQSESNAATSENNAAQSESEALAHLNEFKGIYYGSYAEDPETDPNGNPPDAGDYYWNTTRNVHRVFNGSVWKDALSSANNVSYDNTNSGLSATNVQDAVDEVEGRVEDIEDGTTTVPNADKVDNFDASQTPQANQIPVLNSSGQLWLPFAQIPILVNGQDMMSRTFYVDAENGDDNNDGSESAPFKTIKKACDSVPIGGYGQINLVPGQEIHITSNVYLQYNKYIEINNEDENNKTKIIFDTFLWDNFNCSYSIRLYNSFLHFTYCILENAPKQDNNLGWAIGGGDVAPICVAGSFADDIKRFGVLSLTKCKVNQTRDYFISSKHAFGVINTSQSEIVFSGNDIIALIDSNFGTTALNVYATSITSGKKWVAYGTIGQNVITNLSSLDT